MSDRSVTGEFVRPCPPDAADAAAKHGSPHAVCPSTIVVFGATGDLYARKIAPALYNLFLDGYLPERSLIIASARREFTDDEIRERTREAIAEHGRRGLGDDEAKWDAFARGIVYHRTELDDAEGYERLAQMIAREEKERGLPGNRLFYCAIAPEFFETTAELIARAGLNRPAEGGATRLVVEKPFGTSLQEAVDLNASLRRNFDDRQLYRIDHYLGKETVQNIISFRFANAIFEPLFQRHFVDHVQLTVAETVGMEGRRGQYYDTAGAARDMVQNHMMQLLSLVAMEPPAALDPDAIHAEKNKVLQAIRPISSDMVATETVRAQYTAGERRGDALKGYRQEVGVDPGSDTETYAALRLQIDNWRWSGVPFYLRTGKRLPTKVTEVAIVFRQPPLLLFSHSRDSCDLSAAKPNTLVFRIQPHEGIELSFAAKKPGFHVDLETVRMDFSPGEQAASNSPEAYERLMLDVLRGDDTLYTRSDEVELSWKLFDPILAAWAEGATPMREYAASSWGPREADQLMRRHRGGWRRPGQE